VYPRSYDHSAASITTSLGLPRYLGQGYLVMRSLGVPTLPDFLRCVPKSFRRCSDQRTLTYGSPFPKTAIPVDIRIKIIVLSRSPLDISSCASRVLQLRSNSSAVQLYLQSFPFRAISESQAPPSHISLIIPFHTPFQQFYMRCALASSFLAFLPIVQRSVPFALV
jgi:hypothetical protein